MEIENEVDRENERIATARTQALVSRDAVRFCQLTEEGGFPCDSEVEQELYERGQLDDALQSQHIDDFSPLKARKRVTDTATYRRFLESAGNCSQNIGLNTGAKRALLAEYFPGRFGDEGSNPVYAIDNHLTIGALFEKVRAYSKRRVSR